MRARETDEQRREHLLDRLLPIPRRHGQPVHVKPVRSPCHSPRRLRRTKPRIQTAGPQPSTSTSLRAHFCGRDAPVRRSAGSAIAARCVERECREVAICHYRCIMECRSARARDETLAPTRSAHHPARKVCGERRTSRMNIPETQSLPRSHSARASLTFPPITTWRSPSRRSPTHTTTSIPGMPLAGRPR